MKEMPWANSLESKTPSGFRWYLYVLCFGLFWQDINDFHVKVLAIFESHLRAHKKWPLAKYGCKRCWPNVTLIVTLQCLFLGLYSWLGYQRLPLTSFRHCILPFSGCTAFTLTRTCVQCSIPCLSLICMVDHCRWPKEQNLQNLSNARHLLKKKSLGPHSSSLQYQTIILRHAKSSNIWCFQLLLQNVHRRVKPEMAATSPVTGAF